MPISNSVLLDISAMSPVFPLRFTLYKTRCIIYCTYVSYLIKKTPEFKTWFEKQTLKVQLQIDGRLLAIVNHDHFGATRRLDKYTSEIKFNNGNRVYYTIRNGEILILLAGRNKNSQSKDIKTAKKYARLLHEED